MTVGSPLRRSSSMATSTEAMWRERVSRWRRSGLTADEFAAQEKGFQASTLRYWSSRLRSAPTPVQTAALELLPVQVRPSRELEVRVGEDLWVRVPDDCDVTRAAAFVLALRAGLPS